MRLTLSVLGRELIDIAVSRDDPEPADEQPRSFGFHASGTGQIERADELMLDHIDTYDHRRP
jgi:hypothetical protein